MKEVMAIIRMNMVNQTKEALVLEGFNALTCRKVLGRGKKKVDYEMIKNLVSVNDIESPQVAEAISEGHRLVPKRLITLIVQDDEVDKAIKTIISVNKTGNQGDGKIFVLPILDAVRIRTEETGLVAV